MARLTFSCIDAHTCGNPVRVVLTGAPELKGETMGERRLHFIEEFDWIRRALMFEPRGHDMMSGSFIYEPADSGADAAVLFIETSGCLPMCGHGTIGTVTVMIEEKLVIPKEPGRLRLEVPAGVIDVLYTMEGNKVKSVRLFNVPSFLYSRDLKVDCPDLGELTLDVAYGGNFYAIVDPQTTYKGLESLSASDILNYSPVVREQLNKNHSFVHPTDGKIRGLSHVQWTGRPTQAGSHARNAVFYGDKAIDRSPCGTGTSARMAQWFSRGKLQVGDSFVHESIIGSIFKGKVENKTTVGPYEAIVPSVEGWAMVTGRNEIIVDDKDPFAHGFQVL